MLRILHLEDSKEDALLIEVAAHHERIPAKFTLVRNRSEFEQALEHTHFDIILADSGLPDFDGLTALKMVRKKFPGIVFICLSGSSEPEKIKANFDLGASDFISKNDLPRLIDTLRREAERKK